MGENVKKETVDYLPLGSVVILKGGVQKVVVIARGLLSVATGKEGYFDYGGCLYPQGLVGDQILYFNHRDIVKVVFSGFHDDDDKMMVDNINQWYMESPYERTDVEKLVRARGAERSEALDEFAEQFVQLQRIISLYKSLIKKDIDAIETTGEQLKEIDLKLEGVWKGLQMLK